MPIRNLSWLPSAGGEFAALDELLTRYRDYLRTVVTLRIDDRLRMRVDESVVVSGGVPGRGRSGSGPSSTGDPMSFRLWLRQTALECLLQLRRQHIDAGCRTIDREVTFSDETALNLGRPAVSESRHAERMARERERAALVRQALLEFTGR